MSMILILENVPADVTVEQTERATIPFESWGSGMLAGRDDDHSLSLEKAWHGLHFLLTGDPWGGSGYRAFLLCGGAEQGEDMGYGPARLFAPEEVKVIDEVLRGITANELWSRFDPERMEEAEVYPGIWDEPEEDLREEYVEYFELLKEFVSQTVKDDNSLRISMT